MARIRGGRMTIEEKDKQYFITNFAIELTNCTLDEREQIAEKYYNIIQRLKAENEELKEKAYKDADMIYRLNEEIQDYDEDLYVEKEKNKVADEVLIKFLMEETVSQKPIMTLLSCI